MTEQQKIENLKAENEKLKRLLHDLTPGGSEFYNDPEYCAKWIRENRLSEKKSLTKIIAGLKAQLNQPANQNISQQGEQC